MHIKAKLYPYPVLASFNNDYLDSSFDIEVEEIITEKEIQQASESVFDDLPF